MAAATNVAESRAGGAAGGAAAPVLEADTHTRLDRHGGGGGALLGIRAWGRQCHPLVSQGPTLTLSLFPATPCRSLSAFGFTNVLLAVRAAGAVKARRKAVKAGCVPAPCSAVPTPTPCPTPTHAPPQALALSPLAAWLPNLPAGAPLLSAPAVAVTAAVGALQWCARTASCHRLQRSCPPCSLPCSHAPPGHLHIPLSSPSAGGSPASPTPSPSSGWAPRRLPGPLATSCTRPLSLCAAAPLPPPAADSSDSVDRAPLSHPRPCPRTPNPTPNETQSLLREFLGTPSRATNFNAALYALLGAVFVASGLSYVAFPVGGLHCKGGVEGRL
jgi:hypothetical protein